MNDYYKYFDFQLNLQQERPFVVIQQFDENNTSKIFIVKVCAEMEKLR